MSFKGFQKAIVRAPQNFRQKLNMGDTTIDPVYVDAERRFKELEEQTKRISDESKRYHTSVNAMLDHQIGFSKAIEEIFKPISGKVSDPNSTKPEGNPEGIEASEQYRAVVAELKETLKPDLELIEKRIVEPAQELLKIIGAIRKMATKRNHKQLDLDRKNHSLKKVQDKKEKTPKDEERLYKCEAEVEIAQQEYDYYNEMLKNELPILFRLEADFIKPLFVSLYYMQLNVFYTLSSRMEEMKIPYFDLTTDIVEAFVYKRGNIDEQADSIGITHFKIGHAKSKLEATKRRYANQAGGDPNAAPTYGGYGAGGVAVGAPAYGSPGATAAPAYSSYGQTPPASGAYTATGYPDEKASYGGYASPAATTAAPAYGTPVTSSYGSSVASPVVPAAAAAPGQETCTALYDYSSATPGDLTFTAGTIITILQKTPDQNGWWTGVANGVQGVFPGNYVQLNP